LKGKKVLEANHTDKSEQSSNNLPPEIRDVVEEGRRFYARFFRIFHGAKITDLPGKDYKFDGLKQKEAEVAGLDLRNDTSVFTEYPAGPVEVFRNDNSGEFADGIVAIDNHRLDAKRYHPGSAELDKLGLVLRRLAGCDLEKLRAARERVDRTEMPWDDDNPDYRPEPLVRGWDDSIISDFENFRAMVEEVAKSSLEAATLSDGKGRQSGTPTPGPKATKEVKVPSREEFGAFMQYDVTGAMRQADIAETISREFGTTRDQSWVSKTAAKVREFLKTGGQLPQPSERPKKVSLSPDKIDQGPRLDRRKPRPSEISGDE
jgi:hypothetical protein